MIWLSRDSLEDGTLEPEIDIWESEPKRCKGLGKRVEWLDGAHVESIDTHECMKRYRVKPDTNMELIVVGRRLDQ